MKPHVVDSQPVLSKLQKSRTWDVCYHSECHGESFVLLGLPWTLASNETNTRFQGILKIWFRANQTCMTTKHHCFCIHPFKAKLSLTPNLQCWHTNSPIFQLRSLLLPLTTGDRGGSNKYPTSILREKLGQNCETDIYWAQSLWY